MFLVILYEKMNFLNNIWLPVDFQISKQKFILDISEFLVFAVWKRFHLCFSRSSSETSSSLGLHGFRNLTVPSSSICSSFSYFVAYLPSSCCFVFHSLFSQSFVTRSSYVVIFLVPTGL